jgi:hypothetical protein
MSDLRAAAQQALEALWTAATPQAEEAITALKAALEQGEQEPVAWRTFDGEGGYDYRTYDDNENYRDEWDRRNPNHKGWVEPLYTHPPRREWRNLTIQEIRELSFHNQQTLWPRPDRSDVRATAIPFVRAVEAALRSKNHE